MWTGKVKIGHISMAKEYGGSAHQLLMLAKALSNHDIEQHAVVRNRVLAQRLEDEAGITVRSLTKSAIAACVRMPTVDLVHIHDGSSLACGILLSLVRSIPYVITYRSLRPPQRQPHSRFTFCRAEAIACISDAVAGSLLMRCPDAPIRRIYDACCTRKTCIPPTRGDSTRDEFVVGHVGEVKDSTKGQGLILDIAEHFLDHHPHFRFVLVGQGPDETKLKKRAVRLPNVSFTGWLPNLQVCYETMDVFLMPSRKEALGSAMLEAMSYRVPVIASDVGGIAEVVRHGREGILCGVDDLPAFKDGLLALGGDPTLRRRLGESARVRARQFSPERMAVAYGQLYRQVLDCTQMPRLLDIRH